MIRKDTVKRILGELPLTAEVYWHLRQNGKPLSESFSLRRTQKWLPIWREQAEAAARHSPHGAKVVIFATLRYWIEHATLLSTAIAGLGNQVSLAYLPYANWRKTVSRFDLRQHNRYSHQVLSGAEPFIQVVSLLEVPSAMDRLRPITRPRSMPAGLASAIEKVSVRDVQYTLQVEDFDREEELYQLRLARNTQAAWSAFGYLRQAKPNIVLTPNGSILEMGAVYQVARHLGIPVLTYEFGEQRGRIWLAQNSEVMHQETNDLWEARCNQPLVEMQWEQVRLLFTSRQRADLWQNFSRRWQGLPSQGEAEVRARLSLDARPVALLAANVIGDSLTLGRQVFTASMTEWLQQTVLYFASRPDVQLVVRIHPGERYTHGPSVADVVSQALPDLPEHIHLVKADDPVNTYDLVELCDMGLVYTTTVGMEMAMSGVPVIVAGQTHYRMRGFTLDPDTWAGYRALLEQVLARPQAFRLSRQQVDQAWNYAYRFFFEYPQPFPWHLLHFWNELEEWPVERVLSIEGQTIYGDTFRYLAGEPIDWRSRAAVPVNGSANTTELTSALNASGSLSAGANGDEQDG